MAQISENQQQILNVSSQLRAIENRQNKLLQINNNENINIQEMVLEDSVTEDPGSDNINEPRGPLIN